MLKRIIASTVMANTTQATRAGRSQRPRKEEVAGGEACALISPTPRPSSLGPSVTTPLYSTTVSQALRQTLRVGVLRELLRTPCMRTSENLASTKFVHTKGQEQTTYSEGEYGKRARAKAGRQNVSVHRRGLPLSREDGVCRA